jgi:hypothetical protein
MGPRHDRRLTHKAKAQMETDNTFIVNWKTLRIRRSNDAQRWEIEWSYHGVADLRGRGWIAELKGYDPQAKYDLTRRFLRGGGEDVLPAGPLPIVLEWNGLYDGGAEYGYRKYGGTNGYIVLNTDWTFTRLTRRADVIAAVVAITERNRNVGDGSSQGIVANPRVEIVARQVCQL